MTDSLIDVLAFMSQVQIELDELDREKLKFAKEELATYYQQQALRFVKTLRYLHDIFPSQTGLRILDIGAAPYFLTAFLVDRWGWDIVPISMKAGVFPGENMPVAPHRVVLRLGNRTLELTVWSLNVERDVFPFDMDTFDGVLCLETIEHLGYSPSHMLAECHRVLKSDGKLVITTPNSLNLLDTIRLVLNRTIAFPYSGYGFYGRHQREFTAAELRYLLEECHFRVKHIELTNFAHPVNKSMPIKLIYAALNSLTDCPLPYFQAKRDHIILCAQPVGCPQEAYPESLYTFRHLYHLDKS